MKSWIGILTVLIAGLVGTSCSSHTSVKRAESSSSETGGLRVTKVELGREGAEGQVVIQTSEEPKYNVFKLTDPERIVIDMIDAHLGDGIPSQLTDGDLVKEVRVQALEDSLSALVRLEVFVSEPASYTTNVDGNILNIRVTKAGVPSSETSLPPAPTLIAPSVEAPVADATSPPVSDDASQVKADAIEPPSTDLSAKAETQEPVSSAEANMPQAELPQESIQEAAPAPEVIATPEPSVESYESKMAEKVEEAKVAPASKAETKPNKSDERVASIPEGPKTQEIPSSGLTEGTSLLTELDSKIYTGRRVSLEFQDADIADILRLIAEVSKLNIVTGDDVKGKLTLKLVDVPWDQALDIILTTLGLDKVQHGNILRVAPVEKLKKEREVALANDKAAKQLEPLRLKLININYATGDEMASRIKNLLSERGTVDVDARTNTLIVKDIKEHLSRVENLIKALDTQTPQVRIEARIVQANDSFARSIGIQWGPTVDLSEGNNSPTARWNFPRTASVNGRPTSFPTYSEFAVDALPGGTAGSTLGFRLGSVNDYFNLDLRLNYAENESLARIVSRPSITVLNNRSATILQGSKIPFLSSSSSGTSVQFQEAGISIAVTPQVTNDGAVLMKLNTASNEPGSASVGGNVIINVRQASTEMLVKSGRTAVLGGVFKVTEAKSENGVPGLKDIPVLGWLFKGQSKSTGREEMLIFITPYVLSDAHMAMTSPASDSELEP